jgi:hypothetical protein
VTNKLTVPHHALPAPSLAASLHAVSARKACDVRLQHHDLFASDLLASDLLASDLFDSKSVAARLGLLPRLCCIAEGRSGVGRVMP